MAPIWKRILALIIDWMIVGFVYWTIAKIGALLGIWVSEASEFRNNVLDQSLWFLSFVFFQLGFYIRNKKWGQTIGKQILGIKVEADDLFQFAGRETLKIVPVSIYMLHPLGGFLLMSYFISLAIAMVEPGKSIHDKLLKTFVSSETTYQPQDTHLEPTLEQYRNSKPKVTVKKKNQI